jgi:putative phosphoribosyl transferase
MFRFQDRREAGQKLGALLLSYAADNPVILALPRGGVPVAFEVAKTLGARLDVWVVRKVGVPWHPELGVGAVAEGGFVHLNHDILQNVGLADSELEAAIEKQRREVEARVTRFRDGRPAPALKDRTVIVVDDGIATGGTVRAAIRSIRAQGPKRVILAVPVVAAATVTTLEPEVDRLIYLRAPHELYAIGLWYDDFSQVPDEAVVRLLERARLEQAASRHATP